MHNENQDPKSISLSGPSIKDVRTLGENGIRLKWTNADMGRWWLAKRGRPLGKKIIATIFVKFTQIIWNANRSNKLSNRNTRVYIQYQNDQGFFYPWV